MPPHGPGGRGHGGRGHGGPGWGGPGWGGPGPWHGPFCCGPPPPGERFCWWWCFWCCPPPPPPPPHHPHGPAVVVIDATSNPVNTATPVIVVATSENNSANANYREIKALEFREGDKEVRYYLDIPNDIKYGQTIQVDLGGRVFSIKVPDYVQRGEKVIVIAPAPVNYGDA